MEYPSKSDMRTKLNLVSVLLVISLINGSSSSTLPKVEYGLSQAQKVAAGVCWIENLNKPSEDGGEPICRLGENDDFSLEDSEERKIQNWNEDVQKNSVLNPIGAAFNELLPGYSSCDPFLKEVTKEPNKDYGELLGDRKKGEYPYRGYSHCLLEVMEERHGQSGLDNFKSKWEKQKNGWLVPILKFQAKNGKTLRKPPAYKKRPLRIGLFG